jgi:CheY-like chemotaxis protein
MPKILVADDSIAVRKVAERLLTEAGLGVTLAANGEEALAYLKKDRPDVIVSAMRSALLSGEIQRSR